MSDVPALVPARMVNEFEYCPRLFYLEWVQSRFVDNSDTVEGRYVHRNVDLGGGRVAGPEEDNPVRKARSVMLGSERMGLIAKADIIEGSGGQGGFKRSSQRLESEELRWKQGRFVGLIVRCGLRCGRLVVRRLGGVSIGSGFGKGSVVGCRARMLVWRLVCRLWLVRVGSARMVGWSLFLLYRFRGVICLLLSEKRLLFSTPASVGCVRSPASWADHRRRSHVSCAATPQPVVEAWSIGPRPHSGIRIGVPVAPRFPSWPPTTPSVNTFRIAWVG